MRRMLDELRELNNEEEIEVPADFRDKVIDRINNDGKSSKLKYIITTSCSVAAIALIAVVVGAKGILNNSAENSNIEYDLYTVGEAEVEDGNNDELFETMLMADATSVNSSIEEYKEEPAAKNEAKKALSEIGYYDEIINTLEINNIKAEKINEGVRAKGKKEDIEIALFYFENNVTITQDGEYVIIKEK